MSVRKSHDVTCDESEHVQRCTLFLERERDSLTFVGVARLLVHARTVVANASSLKEERCVAHAPYSVLCVPRADRTKVHHDASCSPNRVCSKRAHRVSASHPLRMRKALARLMSCLFWASPRAPWIRTFEAFQHVVSHARRASRWILVTICRAQWTKVTLCLTLSSAWTYAMRLQCAATERGLFDVSCRAEDCFVFPAAHTDLLPRRCAF